MLAKHPKAGCFVHSYAGSRRRKPMAAPGGRSAISIRLPQSRRSFPDHHREATTVAQPRPSERTRRSKLDRVRRLFPKSPVAPTENRRRSAAHRRTPSASEQSSCRPRLAKTSTCLRSLPCASGLSRCTCKMVFALSHLLGHGVYGSGWSARIETVLVVVRLPDDKHTLAAIRRTPVLCSYVRMEEPHLTPPTRSCRCARPLPCVRARRRHRRAGRCDPAPAAVRPLRRRARRCARSPARAAP